MAKIFEFDVVGIEAVIGNIGTIKKDYRAEVQMGMADYMFRVLANSQQRCPVKTGKLVASLHVGQESEFVWFLADGVPYGIFQEVGFYHEGAKRFIQNPFAMPAFESTDPPQIKLK